MPMRTAIVADDVPEIRFLIARILEPAGFTVLGAENGLEAVELLKTNPCDLLVTDVLMPDGDGIELIEEVKKSDSDVRILAVSGGGGLLEPDYCVKLAKAIGAHAGIMKPFDRVQFLAAVDDALGLDPG
jgi:CheY-like chemotaxis protein